MLSYLKGTALDWFEPLLTSGESPPWLNDYSDFVGELKNNFEPHNPEGEAEANLKNLKMCNNQCILKYLVDFNHLAACVQWGGVTPPSTNKCIMDFCPASRMRFPVSANPTPSTNSIPSPSPLTPDIGNAVPRWPEKIQPPTTMNALTIKGRATKKQTPLRTLIKIKIIMAERVTLVTLVTLMLCMGILGYAAIFQSN